MSDSQSISIFSLFDNKWKFLRFLLFILFIIVLIFCMVEYINCKLSKIQHIEVQFNEKGSTLILENNRLKKAEFLLTSSKCWINTGINIPSNAKIKFSVSGSATLGIHHIVDGANNDIKPISDWIDYEGTDFKKTRLKDWDRDFVFNKAGFGQIISFFHKAGDPTPGKNNMSPNGMVIIGQSSGGSLIQSPANSSTLWLTVNDEVLDFSNLNKAKEQYLGKRKGKEREKWSKHFDAYIVKEDFWDLWFKDNSGQYLIKLEIEE